MKEMGRHVPTSGLSSDAWAASPGAPRIPAATTHTARMRPTPSLWLPGVQLPEHVHNDPASLPLGEVEVIHPAGRVNLGARNILIDVQHRDILVLFGGRGVFAAAGARPVDQRQ